MFQLYVLAYCAVVLLKEKKLSAFVENIRLAARQD